MTTFPRRFSLAVLATTFVVGLARAAAPTAVTLPPPATRMEIVRDTLFGTVIADPYRWLEDQKAPATRAWLDEQSKYFDAVMKEAPWRDRIETRLDSLLMVDDTTLPTERNGRQFFLKRGAKEDVRSLVMRTVATGKETVLIDGKQFSPDGSRSMRILDVSNDGAVLAIGLQNGGEDEVEVDFLDVATRKFRPQVLPRARYSGVRFSGDGKQLFFARYTRTEGPRVFRHVMNTAADRDEKIFGDGLGPALFASVQASDDGNWLLLSVSHGSAGDQVDLYLKNLKTNGPITPLTGDLVARFDARFGRDTLFVRTNWQAPKMRILAIDLAHPQRENWREVLKEGNNPIDSWTVAGGRLLVSYIVNVTAQVYLLTTDGRVLGAVPVGENGAVRELSGRWSQPNAWMRFESYIVPPKILQVTAATNDVKTWWQSSVPFRTSDYDVQQRWFVSKDGTRVPMFVCARRGLVRDGTAPAYLTGYGGFSVNETPSFSARAALWMENGGVWAVPALRGGSEYGEAWHRAGMLGNKQHVFDDFIGAAEALIAQKWTSKDKLAIEGGSNGGLLVGAAFTQRPDLFRAVVCRVPLLDMVRYHRFLVARFWVPEYGSSEDSTQFRWLYAYSPYHHVKIGTQYPAILFMSGDSDTRVDPSHARKMTALVQAANGGDRPVVLHYDAGSGHSGGRPVSKTIADETDIAQFLFWQLGVTPREGAPPPLPPERQTGDTQP